MRSHLLLLLMVLIQPIYGEEAMADSQESKLMTWERPRFQKGGDDAWIIFVILGKFEEKMSLSRSKYRSEGVPKGVVVTRLSREREQADFTRYAGFETLKKLTHCGGSDLVEGLRNVPECLVVCGSVNDPDNLNFLRDTIGFVACALDHGGVAVLDTQVLHLWSGDDWKRAFFELQQPSIFRHVVILESKEIEDAQDSPLWLHTRGMRKFGRPDLSIKGVTKDRHELVVEMLNRFIEAGALGHHIPEGRR